MKKIILQRIANMLLGMLEDCIERDDFKTFNVVYDLAMSYDYYCLYYFDVELE